MRKSFPIFLLLLVAVSASARGVFSWSEAKMQAASDLIVVGTITKVQDLDETNSVLWPGSKFRGVEATFAVSKVLKGDAATRTVVLHYYRFETEWGSPANGPCFLNLTPTDTNQFLLYLVRDGASRFAPVSGQVDPLLDAVRVFHPQSAPPAVTAHSQPIDGSGGGLVPGPVVAGHGDVGQFIIKIAVHYGKPPPAAKELPLISDRWRYNEAYDSHDIEITLSPKKYAVVKSFLDRFFGQPYFRRDGKDSCYLYGLTKPVNGGSIFIAIQNIDGSDTTVIDIHPSDVTSALKIMIDIPGESLQNDSGFLQNRNPTYDHFFVVIENTSSNSICILNEDDMNRALHFEIVTEDGKTITAYRIPLAHTKSTPPYVICLAPEEVSVREIYYGRDWDAFPFPHDPHHADQTSKVTIRAVLEQKPFKDAALPTFWTGRVVSKPYEITLEDDAL